MFFFPYKYEIVTKSSYPVVGTTFFFYQIGILRKKFKFVRNDIDFF